MAIQISLVISNKARNYNPVCWLGYVVRWLLPYVQYTITWIGICVKHKKFRYICVTKTNFRQLQRFIWLNLYHMAEQFFCKIVADLQIWWYTIDSIKSITHLLLRCAAPWELLTDAQNQIGIRSILRAAGTGTRCCRQFWTHPMRCVACNGWWIYRVSENVYRDNMIRDLVKEINYEL